MFPVGLVGYSLVLFENGLPISWRNSFLNASGSKFVAVYMAFSRCLKNSLHLNNNLVIKSWKRYWHLQTKNHSSGCVHRLLMAECSSLMSYYFSDFNYRRRVDDSREFSWMTHIQGFPKKTPVFQKIRLFLIISVMVKK